MQWAIGYWHGGSAVHGKSVIKVARLRVKAEARDGSNGGIVQKGEIFEDRAALETKDDLTGIKKG